MRAFSLLFTLFSLVFLSSLAVASAGDASQPIRIGWIGSMSGMAAKYGAYESAQLAVADINAAGGIRGRRLELVYQDGRCNARDALGAAQHLINSEHVKFLVGGHCSTESLVIAPIAQRAKVLMMAAVTSSPKLSDAGEMIFRVTAPNTEGAKLLAKYAADTDSKTVAIIYEETEYAQGLGESFQKFGETHGLQVVASEGYQTGETDFRSIATRIKAAHPGAIYISVQAPDAASIILRTLKELRIEAKLLGNELTGNAVQSAENNRQLFDNMIFAEPVLDSDAPIYKAFKQRYLTLTGASALPNGFYTAEAYDAVMVLAHSIEKAGEDPVAVGESLGKLHDYVGASGPIEFDAKGDGVRSYVLKTISQGQVFLRRSTDVTPVNDALAVNPR